MLEELRRIAFSDVGEMFDEAGQLRNIEDLPPEVRSALSSLKIVRKTGGGPDSGACVYELKLWDKLKALEILAKHFGLLAERLESDVHHVYSWLPSGTQAASVPVEELPKALR